MLPCQLRAARQQICLSRACKTHLLALSETYWDLEQMYGAMTVQLVSWNNNFDHQCINIQRWQGTYACVGYVTLTFDGLLSLHHLYMSRYGSEHNINYAYSYKWNSAAKSSKTTSLLAQSYLLIYNFYHSFRLLRFDGWILLLCFYFVKLQLYLIYIWCLAAWLASHQLRWPRVGL